MTRTRCLFVLPSMGGGGAERVVTTLLQHLNAAKFDLHLAVARNSGPNRNRIPEHVTVHDLAAPRVLRSIVPLLRTIRRIRPQVVFSTLLHMNLATAISRPFWPRGIRLVVRETNLVDRTLGTTGMARGTRRCVWRNLYRQANTVVCQTSYMRVDLQRAFKLPAAQLTVIPNPVDFDAIATAMGRQPDPHEQPGRTANRQPFATRHHFAKQGPHVVALGRLRRVKGTDRLLAAFPRLLSRHPTAQLWLLGDGPCESALRAQAATLGIGTRVHFVGYQSNPFPWLATADLMAVSSYAESSSNAILEAVACGCPTVAARHPGGTQEMLAGLGLSDRYVPRLDAWEPHWFEQLPSRSLNLARQTYNIPKVVAAYEEVLSSSPSRIAHRDDPSG